MTEPLKIWLYGKPFTGKTYFASQFTKALILSTDGNARFYADNADYKKISDLNDFNREIKTILEGNHGYETIILDVTEHLYDFVRDYYLDKNNVDDESQMGGFAIGWRLIRNGFWSIIKKLANTDYNVIFISHEQVDVTKDALGREKFYYRPALGGNNDELRTKLSGIVQLIGRTTTEEVEINGEVIKNYFVSFGSVSNELSGVRVPLQSLKLNNSYYEFSENLK